MADVEKCLNYITVTRREGDVVYAEPTLASRTIDVALSAAVEIFPYSRSKKMIVEDDIRGILVEITKETTAKDAVNQWKKQFDEKEQKRSLERKQWLASPEGQAYLKAEKEKQEKHNAFVYHSVDEAILALTEIKPADLKSEKTTLGEAVRLCKEVLTVVLKSEDLEFDDKQIKVFQKTLKALGCATYEDANEKFKTAGEGVIGQVRTKENNLDFPLTAFTGLIDNKSSSFRTNLAKFTDGGEGICWISGWLSAQERNTNKGEGK